MSRSFILVLLLASALGAGADERPPIETVVVTASRIPVPLKSVGSSITVINSEQIARRAAPFIYDLLQSVPGTDVSRSGGIGANAQIRIRGAESNQTLVLIDGVEANDLSLGSEFDFAHVLTDDIERIEVLRGAQSSLWGSDALAGVVNIVTREGSGPARVSGFASAGSFGTFEAGGGISGGGDSYHFSLSGQYLDSGGTNVAESGSEDEGYENATLSLRGGYSPHEVLELDLAVRHTDNTKEFDPSEFPSFRPVDGDRYTEAGQTYARAEARLSLFGGAWRHTLGGGITSTDNDNYTDGREDSSTQGRKTRVDYQTSVRFETPRFAEAAHTVIFAVEYEEEQFTQRGAPTIFGDPNQDQALDSLSFVTEYRIDLWDQLFLSGAVRRDDNEAFADATTYRATGAYVHPRLGTKLHFSYGTGVKNPTFSDRYGFTPDTFFGNPNLSPEESEGWEIGIRHAFLRDRVGFEATYFNEELKNEINGFFFDPGLPPFGGFTAVNVDGISEREGVELLFEVHPSAALSLTGSYTYTDSTEPDASGKQIREVRRPKHVWSFNGNYAFMDGRANLNLNADYTGRQKDFDFSTFPATVVELDDYVIVDLAVRYRLSDRLGVFARAENLFDADYQEVFGFETPGIAVFAGIRANFDLP